MSGDWGLSNGHYTYNMNSSYWDSLEAPLQALAAGFIVICVLICVTLLVLQIIGMVKTFKKAGQKGWAAIIPFYNTFTIVKIAGLELWWFIILALLPLLNDYSGSGMIENTTTSFYVSVSSFSVWAASMVMWGFTNYKIAQSFGKGKGFAVGLTLLSPIFWMIMAFSQDIKYKGPAGPYKIKAPENHKK